MSCYDCLANTGFEGFGVDERENAQVVVYKIFTNNKEKTVKAKAFAWLFPALALCVRESVGANIPAKAHTLWVILCEAIKPSQRISAR